MCIYIWSNLSYNVILWNVGTWSTLYTYLQKIYVLTRTFHWWFFQTFHHGDGLGMMTSVSRNWFPVLGSVTTLVVVSNIFYFHPYLGKIPILTNIFQRGWNHQPVQVGIQFFLFWWFWCVDRWDFDEAVNLLYHQDLIETCHLFTYFVAQQNQVRTYLLLQVTVESTICLAWRLSHLVFVDHLLTTHCCWQPLLTFTFHPFC